MKNLYIITGEEGTGKTTLAENIISGMSGIYEFENFFDSTDEEKIEKVESRLETGENAAVIINNRTFSLSLSVFTNLAENYGYSWWCIECKRRSLKQGITKMFNMTNEELLERKRGCLKRKT